MPQPAPRSRQIRLVVDGRPREQLLNTMTLVSAARRHASRRLQLKLLVGRVTSIGLIAGLAAVGALQGVMAGAVDVATHHKLSILSLMLAISALLACRRAIVENAVVTERDLRLCADAIDRMREDLKNSDIGDTDLVHDMRRRYNDVLRRCSAKHTRFDYIAVRPHSTGAIPMSWRRRAMFWADIYVPEAALVGLPLAVALVI